MKQNVLYGVLGVCAVLLVCLLYVLHAHFGMVSDKTAISTKGITFEIATSTAAQERGLGGRAVIPEDYGMLFVFPDDGRPGFWMKDMLAPIDMIWLSSSGTIEKIDASVATSTFPSVFYPSTPIRYVLETRSGFAALHGWNVGDTIELPSPYSSQTDKSVSK